MAWLSSGLCRRRETACPMVQARVIEGVGPLRIVELAFHWGLTAVSCLAQQASGKIVRKWLTGDSAPGWLRRGRRVAMGVRVSACKCIVNMHAGLCQNLRDSLNKS